MKKYHLTGLDKDWNEREETVEVRGKLSLLKRVFGVMLVVALYFAIAWLPAMLMIPGETTLLLAIEVAFHCIVLLMLLAIRLIYYLFK